jgi:hypothetical protein
MKFLTDILFGGGARVKELLDAVDDQDAVTKNQLDNHTQPLSRITQSGASSGQVATWNGTEWEPQTPSGGGGGVTNDDAIMYAIIFGG